MDAPILHPGGHSCRHSTQPRHFCQDRLVSITALRVEKLPPEQLQLHQRKANCACDGCRFPRYVARLVPPRVLLIRLYATKHPLAKQVDHCSTKQLPLVRRAMLGVGDSRTAGRTVARGPVRSDSLRAHPRLVDRPFEDGLGSLGMPALRNAGVKILSIMGPRLICLRAHSNHNGALNAGRRCLANCAGGRLASALWLD